MGVTGLKLVCGGLSRIELQKKIIQGNVSCISVFSTPTAFKTLSEFFFSHAITASKIRSICESEFISDFFQFFKPQSAQRLTQSSQSKKSVNLWQKNFSISQSEFISDSNFIEMLKQVQQIQVQHDKTIICVNLRSLKI